MTLLSLRARPARHACAILSGVFALALGVQARTVTFGETTPLAGNAELARRMLSPLTVLKLRQSLERSGRSLTGQPIDPAKESFALYTPAAIPPGGYGLLVFVPPWNDARLPDGWAPVLDQFGLVYVSAAHSGNDADDLARREPLALAAEENVRRELRVDASRVFVAGFSGGARVATRLALAYPDVFRGAILQAGSDPIGTAQVPLPPRDLFRQFQVSSRLVFIAGDADEPGQRSNRIGMQSLRTWCMFNYESQIIPFVGHAIAGADALARALRALIEPSHVDANAVERCQSEIESELDGRLDRARAMIQAGKRGEAQDLLSEIDSHFGGLGAPRILDLASQAEAQ